MLSCVDGGRGEAGFRFEIFGSREAQARAAAEWVAAAVGDRTGVRVALAGGETPLPVYRLLAGRRWEGVEFLPTDERCVPLDDPRSNGGALRRIFGAEGRVVQLTEGMAVAPPEVVLLGMGVDGHVASLFAGSPVGEGTEGVVRVFPEGVAEGRLSLPLFSLARAAALLLLFCGGEKLRVLLAAGEGMTRGRLRGVRRLRDFVAGGGESPVGRLLAARVAAADGGMETCVYYAD